MLNHTSLGTRKVCVAGGYYLRVQRDQELIETASHLVNNTKNSAAASPSLARTPLTSAQHLALLRESAAVQERLEMLDRKEVQLEKDIAELQVKLDRARDRRRQDGVAVGRPGAAAATT